MKKQKTRFPEIDTRRIAIVDEFRSIIAKLAGSKYRGEPLNVNNYMEAVVGAYYQGKADEREIHERYNVDNFIEGL